MRIAFVGDLHLSSRTPHSRIDDYQSTAFNKLRFISKYCNGNNVKSVYFLGDCFHLKSQGKHLPNYMNNVISVFKTFKNVKVKSIVGNHDCCYNRSDTVMSMPLGTLFLSGAVERLKIDSYSIKGKILNIVGFDFDIHSSQIKDYKLSKDSLNIAVIHSFVSGVGDSFRFDESTYSADNLDSSPFNIFMAGHDHSKFYKVLKGGTTIISPGGVLRGTMNKENISRKPSFIVFDIDVVNGEFKLKKDEIIIPHEDPEKVFSANSQMKKDITFSVKNFTESLAKIEVKNDVYTMMSKLDKPMQDFLTPYLRDEGVIT